MAAVAKAERWGVPTYESAARSARLTAETIGGLTVADDNELAAARDAAHYANSVLADMLEARERASLKALATQYDIIDFQAEPREKDCAGWRVWFGCVLCRWFKRNLNKPRISYAADIANLFFQDCGGSVSPETLSRNYVRD
jgi:hypothetical protein